MASASMALDETSKLKDLFDETDLDKSGAIDKDELKMH